MNTTNNANDAYRAAREKLDRRLTELNHRIREHAERQYADRKNWGFVGDINHVVEVIDELVASFGTKEKTR
jgi:ElaB/YqjD/DUF883 family membrane-anchored ribosome-binding protein